MILSLYKNPPSLLYRRFVPSDADTKQDTDNLTGCLDAHVNPGS